MFGTERAGRESAIRAGRNSAAGPQWLPLTFPVALATLRAT